MSEYIGRREHDEIVKRMEEEHVRLSKRITTIEEAVKENSKLVLAVHDLATSVKSMQEEQQKQGERLQELEEIPARNWNTLKASILAAIGGAVGTGIVAAIINFMK